MGIGKFLKDHKSSHKAWMYYELYIKNFRKRIKKYYSQYGEDREISKFFKKKPKGHYCDIGCFHPIKYSNTFYLFKRGWQGINVDVNQTSIDLFNIARPNDKNICAAISDVSSEVNFFEDDILGPVNTIDNNMYNQSKGIFFKKGIIKKIKTSKIFDIISENILYKKTDFLNIDAEGSDYKIIRQIDLKKSNISLVAIETHDPNGNKLYDFDNISNYFENNQYFVHRKVGPTTLYTKK
ncbi:FkbM family methyltransferase [bacterium]|nr:FkbM family methyltransferase [bacterium]